MPPLPRKLQVEVTGSCNLRCRWGLERRALRRLPRPPDQRRPARRLRRLLGLPPRVL